jgi:hypothetical protein
VPQGLANARADELLKGGAPKIILDPRAADEEADDHPHQQQRHEPQGDPRPERAATGAASW